MVFIIGKLKCYFCGRKEGVLYSVHEYGRYGDAGKRIFYHDQCLEMIESEPEKFNRMMVDKALYIHELKQGCMECHNSKIAKEFKEKIEKLNRKHFERMMPKQY